MEETVDAVLGHDRVLAVGGRTKPALSDDEACELISTAGLTGIVEYEPSEFTFTAKAGTPIAEIDGMLREKNQSLPFDSILAAQGATLGGTVAAGVSGPGRFRYGGVRDFVLGVQLVTGDGRVVRGGGKVVKNAAGFDIPKLMVGSLGRLGIMTELTLKVFPQPKASVTLVIRSPSHQEAIRQVRQAARSRWEAGAIDYLPDELAVYIRLVGPTSALDGLAGEVSQKHSALRLDPETADSFWKSFLSWQCWQACPCVARVPLTSQKFLEVIPELQQLGVRTHLSGGGSLLWLGCDGSTLSQCQRLLDNQGLTGLLLRHDGAQPFGNAGLVGKSLAQELGRRLQEVFDPEGRFPSLLSRSCQ